MASSRAISADTPPGRARAMVLRAFVAQNCTTGCAFGGFGVSLLPLQEQLGVDRGTVSLGLSVVIVMIAACGPLVAALSPRTGLRPVMMIGTSLGFAGWATLAATVTFAPSLPLVLLAFALLVGPAAGLSGVLASSLLAGGWAPHARGRAIGFVTMPMMLGVLPLVGGVVIRNFGLAPFFAGLALLHLMVLPVLAGIVEPSRNDGFGQEQQSTPATARVFLGRPLFWIVILCAGLLNATAITGIVHMVAIALERGLPQVQAALMASLMGGASIAGAFAVGWLSDRLGGARALALIGLTFCLSWLVIRFATGLVPMIVAALLIGAAGAGVFTGVSVIFVRLFGPMNLPRAMALFGLFSLPMTSLLPPIAGWAHDTLGDYRAVMVIMAVTCAIIAMACLMIWRHFAGRPAPQKMS